MRILIGNWWWLMPGIAAINLFGVFFVRRGCRPSPRLLNHESIHTAQMRELLWLPFYLAYVLEFAVRWPLCRFSCNKAYRSISFEREAYGNDGDEGYLARRRHFAQWRRRGQDRRKI